MGDYASSPIAQVGIDVFDLPRAVERELLREQMNSLIARYNALTPAGAGDVVDTAPIAHGVAGVVDVREFGAVGDGVTDDTAAIQAAAAQAATDSLPLFFPPGTYLVADATVDSAILTLTGNFRNLIGAGSGVTTIRNTGSGRLLDLGVYQAGLDTTPAYVRGLRLQGQAGTGVGVRGRNLAKLRMDDVWVTHHGSHGIDVRNCNSWQYFGCRVADNVGWGVFGNYQTSRDAGDDQSSVDASSANHQQEWVGAIIEDNDTGGIYMADASGFAFRGIVQRNAGDGMSLRNMSSFDIQGYFEANTGHNVGAGIGQTTGSKNGRINIFSQRLIGGPTGIYLYRSVNVDVLVNSSGYTGAGEQSVYLDAIFTGTIRGKHNGAGTFVRRYDGANIPATNDTLIFGAGYQFHFANAGDHNSSDPALKMVNNSTRTKTAEFGGLVTVDTLGVGNSAAATTLGSVTDRIEVFDDSGASLGFLPVYDGIT